MKTYKPSQVAVVNTRPCTKKTISKMCTITKDPLPVETETQIIKTLSNQRNSFLDNTIHVSRSLRQHHWSHNKGFSDESLWFIKKEKRYSWFYWQRIICEIILPSKWWAAHVMKVEENGLTRCDNHCLRYNVDEFCGYAIAVS